MDKYANRLKVFRQKEKLTQIELSDILHKNSEKTYGTSYISKLENGYGFVPPKMAQIIVDEFPRWNYNYLIGISDQEYKDEINPDVDYNKIIHIEAEAVEYLDESGNSHVGIDVLYMDEPSKNYIKIKGELENNTKKPSKGYVLVPVDEQRIYPLDDTTEHDKMMKILEGAEEFIKTLDAGKI